MKVGDMDSVAPSSPNGDQYKQEVLSGTAKFQEAFTNYQFAQTSDEKTHYEQVMTQQMQLINAAVKEVKQAGVQKQGAKLQSDYSAYLANPTDQNTAALEHDLTTLQDYMQ